MKTSKPSPGFTLLEVMIAIGVFMMVLTAIYSIWLSILKGTRVGLAAAADAQRSRVAMRAVEDALLTAQLSTANIRYYAFVTDTKGSDFAEMSFVSRLPATFLGSGRYGDASMRRVSFTIKPGAKGLNELVMTQAPMLMDTEKVEPYSLVLASDVSKFDLEFWDMQKRDWIDEWIYTNQLPRMVKVTLGLGKVTSSSRPFDLVTRVVAIPGAAVTPDIQRPLGAGQGLGQTNQVQH
jgi:type II secretion system protein J